MFKIFPAVLTLIFIFAGVLSASGNSLTVVAAANLSFVIAELKEDFINLNPGSEITVITGSSGNFTAQIIAGAPFDIFLSADREFPEKVRKAGFAANEPVVYASGRLALFSVKKYDLTNGLSFLKGKDVQRIAIANPAVAPYGRASIESLSNSGLLADVSNKFVFTENILQAAQVTLTAADTGFIALSLVYDPAIKDYNKEGIYWIEVDPGLYTKIEQSMVILKHGSGNPLAEKFFNYMLSEGAVRILKKYGYR
ncbi:MAG: molybdate ABC transporter substrate-binding protein [Brevinematales bacterium]|jgi:molybdate transport system substrate-binding protein